MRRCRNIASFKRDKGMRGTCSADVRRLCDVTAGTTTELWVISGRAS